MRGIIMQEMSVLGLIRDVKTQTRRLAKDRTTPLYRVGETLYVKEAWHYFGGREYVYQQDRGAVRYQADCESEDSQREWWNRMFMPAWAARFHVTISLVRRQRLLEIADADADAEGIEVMHGWIEDVDICRAAKLIPHCGPEDSRAWYLAAWDTMHKRDAPAASNPVIDAYTFTVARC